MYRKAFPKIRFFTHCGVCASENIPNINAISSVKRMAVWWGHDTLEDKEARRRKAQESRVSMKRYDACQN